MTEQRSSRPGLGRAWLLATVLPVLFTAAAMGLIWSWLDDLPDPVATHWSSGPTPDGFTAVAQTPRLALLALIGLPISVIGVALAGRQGTVRRLSVGLGVGLSASLALISVVILFPQVGLSDARNLARSPDAPIGMSILVGIAVGLLASLAVPGSRVDDAVATEPVPADAPRMSLAPGERVTWAQWMGTGRVTYAACVAVLGLHLVIGVLTRMWVTWCALGLFVTAVVALTLVFRVSVGQGGLVLRGVLGLPRITIPLTNVAVARAISVSPLGDFGGWGLRIGRDRTGIVVRRGEAIEVTQGNGQRFVVTVDDAARGAALLNTLADRGRTLPVHTP